MKKRILITTLFSVIGFCSFSQENNINVEGVIKSLKGPVAGATISVKNVTGGYSTDGEGRFSINNIAPNSVLVVTAIGFENKEVQVSNQRFIEILMQISNKDLSELVIVAYGSSSKRDVTGSISSMKGQELTNVIAGNPTTALQGRMSGIQVESFGGQPGGVANVFIRGVNSLSNSSPLYVVDGQFVDNMNYINPIDIVDISVLKDAAVASLYGLRSANGVVLITTNHGKKNKPLEVTFNARIGFETAAKKLEYINGQQFTDYLNQRYINDGNNTVLKWNGVNTDWQKESLQTGYIADYSVSLEGGGEKSSYYTSANYFTQDGILIGSGFKRINLRFNSKHDLGKFHLTQSIGIAQGKLQENNWFGWDGVPAPTLSLKNPANEGGYEAPSLDIHGPGGINHYGFALLEDNLVTTRTFFGNMKLEYELIAGLKIALRTGINYIHRHNYQFTPTFFMSNIDAVLNNNTENDLTDYRQEDLNIQVEPTISYDKSFDQHNISALLGYTYFEENQKSNGIYGQGTANNNIRSVTGLPASESNILLGQINESVLLSFFGRINYNYAKKYYFSATIRRDATSRFEPANRSGVFPSFSAGWDISKESFWNVDKISYLKLRVSYGVLGSTVSAFYPTEGVYSINSGTSFGGAIVNGIAQTTLVDKNLTWETTSTFDIGLDVGLFDNSISLTMDYYSKNIQDVLVSLNVPATSGVSNAVITNGGKLINQGFEIGGNYIKREGDFTLTAGVNFSFNINNKAEELPNPILGPGIDEDLRIVNRTISGEKIGAFYGYKVLDKVDPTTGNFVRVDVNKDGTLNQDDQTILGDPNPDFTYGINFSGKYKNNLDFTLNFTGVQGNDIYNLGRYYSILWQDGGKLKDVLNSWTPSNTNTNIPRATISDPAGNKSPSSFFVEDGSYFRLKNIEIGYNFGVSDAISWIKGLRVALSIQNVFLLTSYSGYDPDVSSTNGGRANRNTGVPGLRAQVNPLLGRGLDARVYPMPRTYMLTFRMSL